MVNTDFPKLKHIEMGLEDLFILKIYSRGNLISEHKLGKELKTYEINVELLDDQYEFELGVMVPAKEPESCFESQGIKKESNVNSEIEEGTQVNNAMIAVSPTNGYEANESTHISNNLYETATDEVYFGQTREGDFLHVDQLERATGVWCFSHTGNDIQRLDFEIDARNFVEGSDGQRPRTNYDQYVLLVENKTCYSCEPLVYALTPNSDELDFDKLTAENVKISPGQQYVSFGKMPKFDCEEYTPKYNTQTITKQDWGSSTNSGVLNWLIPSRGFEHTFPPTWDGEKSSTASVWFNPSWDLETKKFFYANSYYGVKRFYGYLKAPQDGEYKFVMEAHSGMQMYFTEEVNQGNFTYGDDYYFSIDGNTKQNATIKDYLILDHNGSSGEANDFRQESEGVDLVGGKYYYFEIIQWGANQDHNWLHAYWLPPWSTEPIRFPGEEFITANLENRSVGKIGLFENGSINENFSGWTHIPVGGAKEADMRLTLNASEALTQGDFLRFGHNGKTLNTNGGWDDIVFIGATDHFERLKREWCIDFRTSNDYTLFDLEFKSETAFPTVDANGDALASGRLVLLVSEGNDFSIANTKIYDIEKSSDGKTAIAKNVPLTGDCHVTIGYIKSDCHNTAVVVVGFDNHKGIDSRFNKTNSSGLTIINEVDGVPSDKLQRQDHIVLGHNNGTPISSYSELNQTTVGGVDFVSKNLSLSDREWCIRLHSEDNVDHREVNFEYSFSPPVYDKKICLVQFMDGDYTNYRVIKWNNIKSGEGNSTSFYETEAIEVHDGDKFRIGTINHFQGESTFDNNKYFLGSIYKNYHRTVTSSSGGLTVLNPSELGENDHLGIAFDSYNPGFSGVSPFLSSGRTWQINEYGEVGLVDLRFEYSTVPTIDETINGLAVGVYSTEGINYYPLSETAPDVYETYGIDLNDGDKLFLKVQPKQDINPAHLQTCIKGVLELGNAGQVCTVNIRDDVDALDFNNHSVCEKVLEKALLKLEFYNNEKHNTADFDFDLGLALTGEGTPEAVAFINNLTVNDLHIDKLNPKDVVVVDVSSVYDQLTAIHVYPSQLSGALDNINFRAGIQLTEKDKVNPSKQSLLSTNAVTGDNSLKKFSWEISKCPVESYEFQLLKLENQNDEATDATLYTDLVNSIDWSNAVAIDVKKSSSNTAMDMDLTLAQGKGYYTWRVRPIGDYFEGGKADARNWGNWSTHLTQGQEVTYSADPGLNEVYLLDEQFDEDKNFIFNRVYAEGGRKKEMMTYANGLLQSEQTQVVVENQGQKRLVVTETIYDYSGRPIINTLPAPTAATELKYVEGVLTKEDANGVSQPYTAANFDEDDNYKNKEGEIAADGGEVIDYYDGNSTTGINEPGVASAEGYPFARTIYSNDGLNRPVEISGVGKDLALNGDFDKSSHTVKIEYTSSTDAELIRIFGKEAPSASTVLKRVTTDQNKVSTIAYLDKQGRVIATGVGYNNFNIETNSEDVYDDNLLPIPSQDLEGTTQDNTDKDEMFASVYSSFSRDQEVGEQRLFSMTDITFTKDNQTIKVGYDITPEQIEAQCGFYCTDCEYDVTFRVKDITNNILLREYTVKSAGGTIIKDGTCNPTVPTLLVGKKYEDNPKYFLEGGDKVKDPVATPGIERVDFSAENLAATITGLVEGKYRVERYIGLNQAHKTKFAQEGQDDYAEKVATLLEPLQEQLALIKKKDPNTDFDKVIEDVLAVHNAQVNAPTSWYRSQVLVDQLVEVPQLDEFGNEVTDEHGHVVLEEELQRIVLFDVNDHVGVNDIEDDFIISIKALCCEIDLAVALPNYSVCKELANNPNTTNSSLTYGFEEEIIALIDLDGELGLEDFDDLQNLDLGKYHLGLGYSYVPVSFSDELQAIDFGEGDFDRLIDNMLEDGEANYDCDVLWNIASAMAFEIGLELNGGPKDADGNPIVVNTAVPSDLDLPQENLDIVNSQAGRISYGEPGSIHIINDFIDRVEARYVGFLPIEGNTDVADELKQYAYRFYPYDEKFKELNVGMTYNEDPADYFPFANNELSTRELDLSKMNSYDDFPNATDFTLDYCQNLDDYYNWISTTDAETGKNILQIENIIVDPDYTWEPAMYKAFYHMTKNVDLENSPVINVPVKTFDAKQAEMIAQCKEDCDANYDLLVTQLKEQYNTNTVDANNNPVYKDENGNLITESDICCTAQALVEDCQSQCKFDFIETTCFGDETITGVGTKDQLGFWASVRNGSFDLTLPLGDFDVANNKAGVASNYKVDKTTQAIVNVLNELFEKNYSFAENINQTELDTYYELEYLTGYYETDWFKTNSYNYKFKYIKIDLSGAIVFSEDGNTAAKSYDFFLGQAFTDNGLTLQEETVEKLKNISRIEITETSSSAITAKVLGWDNGTAVNELLLSENTSDVIKTEFLSLGEVAQDFRMVEERVVGFDKCKEYPYNAIEVDWSIKPTYDWEEDVEFIKLIGGDDFFYTAHNSNNLTSGYNNIREGTVFKYDYQSNRVWIYVYSRHVTESVSEFPNTNIEIIDMTLFDDRLVILSKTPSYEQKMNNVYVFESTLERGNPVKSLLLEEFSANKDWEPAKILKGDNDDVLVLYYNNSLENQEVKIVTLDRDLQPVSTKILDMEELGFQYRLNYKLNQNTVRPNWHFNLEKSEKSVVKYVLTISNNNKTDFADPEMIYLDKDFNKIFLPSSDLDLDNRGGTTLRSFDGKMYNIYNTKESNWLGGYESGKYLFSIDDEMNYNYSMQLFPKKISETNSRVNEYQDPSSGLCCLKGNWLSFLVNDDLVSTFVDHPLGFEFSGFDNQGKVLFNHLVDGNQVLLDLGLYDYTVKTRFPSNNHFYNSRLDIGGYVIQAGNEFIVYGTRNIDSTNNCTSKPVGIRWQVAKPEARVKREPITIKSFKESEAKTAESMEIAMNMELNACEVNMKKDLEDTYINTCMNNLRGRETVTAAYGMDAHHYTLYYYDRAGNLVQTVPPAGVDNVNIDITDAANGPDHKNEEIYRTDKVATSHQLKTLYYYNSLGQLTKQATPDGGETDFIYNKLQQLRFSQNAQQEKEGAYSYTKYDPLGRVVEVGELEPIQQNTTDLIAFERLDAEFNGYVANSGSYSTNVIDLSTEVGCQEIKIEYMAYTYVGEDPEVTTGTTVLVKNAIVHIEGGASCTSKSFKFEDCLVIINSDITLKNITLENSIVQINEDKTLTVQESVMVASGSEINSYGEPVTLSTGTTSGAVTTTGSGTYSLNPEVDYIEVANYPVHPNDADAAQHPDMKIGTKAQINDRVLTEYGVATAGVTYQGEEQSYLRNRVSHTFTDKDGNVMSTNDQVHTYYSYDPHGNVKWLMQEIPGLGRKTVAYDYDLISGNVNQVDYNAGLADAFFHRYTYDIENRLTTVETSTNQVIWEKDAEYTYFAHGPLRSIKLGHNEVQNIDYAYTIHGWLKAINHPTDNPVNQLVDDAFGMRLHYFNGDYKQGEGEVLNGDLTDLTVDNPNDPYNASSGINQDNLKNLYNGNITAISSHVQATDAGAEMPTITNTYRYDYLNRIREQHYQELSSSNTWTQNTDFYNSDYQYDANGNITTLNRFADNALIDQLSYEYVGVDPANSLATDPKDQDGNYLLTNRLRRVDDAIEDSGLDTDYKDPEGANNQYDAIGNLTKDEANGVTEISWTVAGKVEKVVKEDGAILEFRYDASGNRVEKQHTHGTTGTVTTSYYVRDASGNVMGVYKKEDNNDIVLSEQSIYGSDRLGLKKRNVAVSASATTVQQPTDLVVTGYISESPIAGSDFGKLIIFHNQSGRSLTLEELQVRGFGPSGAGNPVLFEFNFSIKDRDKVIVFAEPTIEEIEVFEACAERTFDDNIARLCYLYGWDEILLRERDDVLFYPNSEFVSKVVVSKNNSWVNISTEGISLISIKNNEVIPTQSGCQLLGTGQTRKYYNENHSAPTDQWQEGIIDIDNEPSQAIAYYTYTLDNKSYELKDHLGNVRATISDYVQDNSGSLVVHINSAHNYYPFGWEMPGDLTQTGDGYRYSFNGIEHDPEISGSGNTYAWMERSYDARLGRWMSVDGAFQKYPMLSPYSFVANSPNINKEVNGDVFETIWDIGNVVVGLGAMGYNLWEGNYEEAAWDAGGVVVDAGATLLPFVPGGAAFALKTSRYAAKFLNASAKLSKLTYKGKKLFDMGKKMENIGGFASKTLLNEHFIKHADEFAGKFKNADEYLKGAQNFFKRESKDIVQYTRNNGDVVRFDPSNNIFGVAGKDGTIRTMFKPDEGIDYFKDELTEDLGKEALDLLEDAL